MHLLLEYRNLIYFCFIELTVVYFLPLAGLNVTTVFRVVFFSIPAVVACIVFELSRNIAPLGMCKTTIMHAPRIVLFAYCGLSLSWLWYCLTFKNCKIFSDKFLATKAIHTHIISWFSHNIAMFWMSNCTTKSYSVSLALKINTCINVFSFLNFFYCTWNFFTFINNKSKSFVWYSLPM